MAGKKKEYLKTDADQEYTQYVTVYDHTVGASAEDDAVEVITVHHDAYLMGIELTGMMNFTAADDYYLIELSQSGNFQGWTNDNSDTIMVVMNRAEGTFANGMTSGARTITIRTKIFFRAGDKIYINVGGTPAKVVYAAAVLFWQWIGD